HPKLIVTDSAKSAFELLLKNEFLNNGEADLSLSAMKKHLSQHDSNSDEQDSPWTKSRLGRLLCNGSKLSRYRNGIVWVTPLHPELAIQGSIPPLPLDSFGDDSSLNETGRLSLAQHLADVADEVTRLTTNLRVSETLKETLETAARCHDLGKADPRFQAMLLNKPLNIAFMQSKLWAKSGVPGFNAANTLPANFRHEMLSLNLLDRIDIGKTDEDVLRHIVAAHHGYGRPFAPVCVDEAPEGFCLDEFELGAVTEDDRSSWLPAHRLNSKIADRFWKLNRRFGWWGLAQLETILRLADWTASAAPGSGDVKSLKFRPAKHEAKSAKTSQPLILGGIDGSSPLGFLAALGVFRTLSRSDVGEMWSFGWQQHAGAWRPALFNDSESATTENELVGMLMELLTVEADSHPALADPAPTVDRRTAFDNVANAATPQDRDAADWLSCNGSDMTGPEVISQLQTTRRDYHSINIRGLVEGTQASHVHRTLFQPWDYADPIAGVSLHLEPREDRRHAYQWHTPSGDPTRQLFGGMMGANRLALEAWPFFQSLPYLDKLATVGFQGTRVSNTRFNWPIWESPISIAVVSSLLSLAELQTDKLSIDSLSGMGIVRVYQSRKILVGKTPNLTTASPVMA
ncbi:MAG: CRISPR-associated endonuclease Cas3'', partial [Planctomycetaceae bacterium]|nr:CRISPR-associated endonuclease Cas3'' [Planctomycetaceae bacterium]